MTPEQVEELQASAVKLVEQHRELQNRVVRLLERCIAAEKQNEQLRNLLGVRRRA